MATHQVSRLAPVNARDGVDTRKKENWATVATGARKTICRSDTIIGLGVPTAQWDCTRPWGDLMLGTLPHYPLPTQEVVEDVDFEVWRSMEEEPWKFREEERTATMAEVQTGPSAHRIESYQDEKWSGDRAKWKRVFGPIARAVASKCMTRWIQKDVTAFVTRIKNATAKIQAFARGHLMRRNDPHQDCAMCLSHRICPLRTDVGYMCRDCAEMGPHEDLFPEDGWNWFRSDYVDDTRPMWNKDLSKYWDYRD